jgi:hypothetical protein
MPVKTDVILRSLEGLLDQARDRLGRAERARERGRKRAEREMALARDALRIINAHIRRMRDDSHTNKEDNTCLD